MAKYYLLLYMSAKYNISVKSINMQQYLSNIKDLISRNIENIIIVYTLIEAPISCFFKEAVRLTPVFSVIYDTINAMFIAVVIIYFATCNIGIRRWETWVAAFLLLVALYNLFFS